MAEFDNVIQALSSLRVGKIIVEYDLQNQIADVLNNASINFKKEYKLGPRNRVDFITVNGIAIEIKKGKPNRRKLYEQAERYMAFPEVKAMILVVETSIRDSLPSNINGKPCTIFGLQKLWGIAL